MGGGTAEQGERHTKHNKASDGRSERRELDGPAHAARLELARRAQLEVAVADDRVRALAPRLGLLALAIVAQLFDPLRLG